MNKILKLSVVLVISFVNSLEAQQLPLFSQYMFNTFLINPAAAGMDGCTNVNLTAREQWLGLADAPKNYSITGQTRLTRDNFLGKMINPRKRNNSGLVSERVGLGINFYNDKNGLVNHTGFQFTYAYHLPLERAELSLGISASAYQMSLNRDRMVIEDNTDDLINRSDYSRFIPDFNFGALYVTKDYYAGFSVSQLMQSYVQLGNSGVSDAYRLYRHYYLHGGYNYAINRDYLLQSSMLIKYAKTANPQFDITAKVLMQDQYWAGLSFRTGSAFILMGGVTVDNYSFGYAFDYNLSSIRKHSFGSHEIMVAIKFGHSKPSPWSHKF